MRYKVPARLPGLILGDVVVFGLVTVAGFTSHGELGSLGSLGSAGLRVLTTFLPLCAAWGLVAPWLGAFDLPRAAQPRQLWRPLLAMTLAAPMVGWLRGVWLNQAIPPVFVLVVGAFSALGILLWRSLWLWLLRPRLAKQVPDG
jgi:Protein of unknown function (DUF3054)